ncbi:MAG: NAD(P)/FAD-dependent oxidoreductase [Candidatus Saganbacteria bacterium]|nr:NAD(P)/FAD-dependent oxidoreductase [Candidatus Saganbacteria bacterium]
MNGIYDVLIIGGGVTGTAIARELSRYRLSTALLEKEEELAFGVSKSNSGIIHPGTQNPAGSLKGRLCVQGNRLVRQWAKELGVDFREVGELILASSQEDILRLNEIKAEAEKLGVPSLRIVDRAWLKANEPNLTGDVVAALFAPTAGIISPYRFVYDIAENAAANGVTILTGEKVVSIKRSPYYVGSNDPRFEIVTSNGTFRSRFVINCAGLYADDVSRLVDIDTFTIKPRKGEEFILDKKKEHITRHLLFPLPQKNSKGILVIKTADGNPMVGPTAEEVDSKEDLSTTDEGMKKVIESVRKMIPTISENDIIAYFAGLRPVAGEDFIIRHEDKVPGFVNVAGIQSPGLTSAPAIALMVKDILKKNGLSMRRKLFFKKHRKRTVHIFEMPFKKIRDFISKDPSYGDIICRCEMVSAKEIREAVKRGARTMDGIKFRTRCQSGRCHGSFCTTRAMKILAEEMFIPITKITKRGKGSEMIKGGRRITND